MKKFILIASVLFFASTGLAKEPIPTQTLPVKYTFTSNNTVIKLEEVKKFEQKQIGLMGRKSMDENHGMIFIYKKSSLLNFWMKNTLIPLDMIFLANNKIVGIIANVPPCLTPSSCPSYGPNHIANQVIELNAGKAKKLKLKEGQTIKLRPAK
jgi:uncharacterized protein